jgi:hypothetical protein
LRFAAVLISLPPQAFPGKLSSRTPAEFIIPSGWHIPHPSYTIATTLELTVAAAMAGVK